MPANLITIHCVPPPPFHSPTSFAIDTRPHTPSSASNPSIFPSTHSTNPSTRSTDATTPKSDNKTTSTHQARNKGRPDGHHTGHHGGSCVNYQPTHLV
ncbi:hypothetical protein BKA81DRAFT_358554 [Phyllosticta paracitricarpa]